ncbi:DUF488 domain-containing protein [Streptomyces sp. NPDC053048]|uniref:DUF488 domain-containing protein n=1 Tax=Streptomyces sp. NPDC053048 TaxID=3365694 RepID=UPI0037CD466B
MTAKRAQAGHAGVRVRRVYDPAGTSDGRRVLVDRIWPRGLTKEEAALDEWCKDVAPSTELRKWYGHDPARFAEFSRRYRGELHDDPVHAEALRHLRSLTGQRPLTLLTATKDVGISAATVLKGELEGD